MEDLNARRVSLTRPSQCCSCSILSAAVKVCRRGFDEVTVAHKVPATDTPQRLSVVIPHLNTPDALRDCLSSLVGQTLDFGEYEIIVVDNGSKMSLDDVWASYPSVRFLNELTPGPGPARNLGVKHARASAIAFIDADCRADSGWLQAAVNAIEANPENAVIGGDVLIAVADPRHLSGIEAYDSVFAFRQRYYILKRNFSGTGNLALSKKVFLQVGEFGGIGIAEDLDWGQRACAMGYPARFEPKMVIYHPSRQSWTDLKLKWGRHVSHACEQHFANGKSAARWYLSALVVLLSIPVHSIKLLASPRVSGMGSKFRGVLTLASIRIWRVGRMLSISAGSRDAGSSSWNRP